MRKLYLEQCSDSHLEGYSFCFRIQFSKQPLYVWSWPCSGLSDLLSLMSLPGICLLLLSSPALWLSTNLPTRLSLSYFHSSLFTLCFIFLSLRHMSESHLHFSVCVPMPGHVNCRLPGLCDWIWLTERSSEMSHSRHLGSGSLSCRSLFSLSVRTVSKNVPLVCMLYFSI